MDEIQNRVASSALMVFDLEDYYPEGIKTQVDLSVWLIEGFLLKEIEFRQALAGHDWRTIGCRSAVAVCQKSGAGFSR